MLDNLKNRVSVVTGAGSGIGAACALNLAEQGAIVVLLDQDGTSAQARAADIVASGGIAHSVVLDVADETAVDTSFQEIVDTFGRIDIAVNNAGISVPPASVALQSTSDWRKVMAVNLDGVFFCMRAQLRAMLAVGGGVITNVGSILSVVAAPSGSCAYVASKHAVVGLSRSAAASHAVDGIRVNAVGPGYVETPMVRNALDPEALAQRALLQPIGRLGRPEEIAALIGWLSSDAASFVTGAFYAIDGGYTAI